MHKIMIVEDDSVIAKAIAEHLHSWGYDCFCVDNFRAIDEQFAALSPHLLLLDVSLPYYNGYHWCREIRRFSQTPIIFISSATDNMNVVMAMNMGGDDFIAKPFDLSVLTAKVQALMRRAYDFNAHTELLERQGVVLNLADASLTYQQQRLELSRNEFRILQALFAAKGQVVTREKLMKLLWETDCFVDDNTLTVNINRLRKRLAELGLEELIATKKGLGYLVS